MRNLFRKIEALLVATVMILSMCTAAFASNAAMAAGHATIKGITPENNITVTAYKIIDYNANGTYSPVLDGTIDMNADGSLNPTAANVAALATDRIGDLPTHFEITGPEENGDYITSALTPGTWMIIVTGSETTLYNPVIISAKMDTDGIIKYGTLDFAHDT